MNDNWNPLGQEQSSLLKGSGFLVPEFPMPDQGSGRGCSEPIGMCGSSWGEFGAGACCPGVGAW